MVGRPDSKPAIGLECMPHGCLRLSITVMERNVHHDSGTVTRLLDASRRGDHAAMDDLFDRVYEELQQIARSLTANVPERADLNPAALVNAACERLLSRQKLNAEDRRHFFFIFGRAMHDVVVEEARRATARKRTPSPEGLLKSQHTVHVDRSRMTLGELGHLLEEFQQLDPEAAEVVRLRFFAGRSMRQTASDLGITLAAVRSHWAYAKAWLSERAESARDKYPPVFGGYGAHPAWPCGWEKEHACALRDPRDADG